MLDKDEMIIKAIIVSPKILISEDAKKKLMNKLSTLVLKSNSNNIQWLKKVSLSNIPGYRDEIIKILKSNTVKNSDISYNLFLHYSGIDIDDEIIDILINKEDIDISSLTTYVFKDRLSDSSLLLKKDILNKYEDEIVYGIKLAGINNPQKDKIYEVIINNLDLFSLKNVILSFYDYFYKTEYLETIEKLIYKNISELKKGNVNEFVACFNVIKESVLKEKLRNYINKNIDMFFKDVSTNTLFYYLLKDKELNATFSAYIDSHFDLFIKKIYLAINKTNKVPDDKKTNDILDIVYMIIDEIATSQNKSFMDIKFIDRGGTGFVFSIGNKVIKIGKKRDVPLIRNNPYINSPLLRRTFENGDNSIFIEVTNLLETVKQRGITENEIFELYCKIRDYGLVWTDVSSRNVGWLLEDNNMVHPSDEAVELKDRNRYELNLSKGELVVLDLDHIFDEDDENILGENNTYYEYENRYQEMKNGRGL